MILIISCLIAIISSLWLYARWHRGSLERRGLVVVESSNPIMGNVWDLYTKAGGPQDLEWMKKYGEIFGLYEGRQPVVYICNPDLLRLICVKDAHHFDAKRPFYFGDQYLNEIIDFLPQEKWRPLRPLITTVFSSGRLKMMSSPIIDAIEDMMANLNEKFNKSKKKIIENVAIDQVLHELFTDIFARVMFSMKSNGKCEDHEIIKIIKKMLTPSPPGMELYASMLGHAFPFLRRFFSQLLMPLEPIAQQAKIFEDLLSQRNHQNSLSPEGNQKRDLIDLCLLWYDQLETEEFQKLHISKATILIQVLVFGFGGQDQLATILSCLIYQMVCDPLLENRIYQEIDQTFAKYNGKLDMDNLPDLKLLNSCLLEVTRLYTIFHRSDRLCTKDWTNASFNISFRKGDIIVIPVYCLNQHPSIPSPDKFLPERFFPENSHLLHPHWTSAHGIGPRSCISKGFAQKIIPFAMAHILKNLKFLKRQNTQITQVNGGFFMTMHMPIFVDVLKRQ